MNTDFSQKDGKIWLDGVLVEWADARAHVLTQGLNYAGSVFEGIRAYEGEAFRLADHIQRFQTSAALMGFKIPYSAEEMESACKTILKHSGLSEAYIRPVAWRGADRLELSQECRVHCAIACLEWTSYFREDGISLQIAKYRKPGPRFAQVQSKTAANYAMPALAKSEAEKAGYDDALMLDDAGYIAEATASNIFLVQRGIVKTSLPAAALAGITRAEILDICRRHDIPCEETNLTIKEVFEADEVFVCGTAAEITAVARVETKSYKCGPLTNFLRSEYLNLVRPSQRSKSGKGESLKYAELLTHSRDERSYDIATDPLIHEAWLRTRNKMDEAADEPAKPQAKRA